MRNGRRDHAPMRRPPDPRTIPYPRRALAWASIVLVLSSEASCVSARVNKATKILRSVASSAATHRNVYTSDTTSSQPKSQAPKSQATPPTVQLESKPNGPNGTMTLLFVEVRIWYY